MIHLRQIISSVGQIFQLPGRKPFTAKSALCDTKMRNFLLGVVLGLLAVVHSTPVDTVTQIVPKAEDDVFREAVTDGFLVDYSNLPSVTTESPRTNTSVQPSQQPGSTTQASQHGLEIIEGSAIGEINDGFTVATTTQSISTAPSSTSTSDQTVVSQTTYNILSTLSDSGSGDGEFIDDFSTTTSSTTSETSPVSTTSMALLVRGFAPPMFGESPEPTPESYSGSGSGSGSGQGQDLVSQQTAQINFVQAPEPTAAPMPAGHTTPDWIIILGFIVGVAALVLLCVAIATRDKWNAPKYAAQPATDTNASNQQRALEMETFLNKEMPKENGKAAEYTVIPLDELPENYSSH